MRNLAIVACAAVLAVALAGCAQGGASSGTAGSPSAASGSSQAASAAVQAAEPHVEGVYYGRYELVDADIGGVPVFSVFLPDGWNASLYSDWSVVSADVPCLDEIVITSPDGLASIVIDSCQSYTQGPTGAEGQDLGAYTTYMNYLDAGAFTDAYISSAYGSAATLVRELPEDPDTLSQLRQYLDILVAQANEVGAQVTNNGSIGNVTSTAQAADCSMCRRQYQVGSQQLETSVVGTAVMQTISGPALTEQFLHWRIPYSIVFTAANAEAFEQYYDTYQLIVANSYFTTNYYAAVEYVSACLAAAAMDAKAAASGYSASGYTSTSSESTNEKVINMWDDVINEVDSYTTLDGGTVKTSMYNDVVAQSGDEFFVGSSTSDIPAGFTELSKSY